MGYRGWLGFGLPMNRNAKKRQRTMQAMARLSLGERPSPPFGKATRPLDIFWECTSHGETS